ncbi:putative T7SS-secreted protein [Streptomyces sp. NPDC048442]|uniref:putative T7SS-secreted protein n=1 Tax=Streptomyces sp. NPDC048442 TaxID=3154823 RepID=UPI00343AE30B
MPDFGDTFDKVVGGAYDKVREGVDWGKEKLGEGVDWATDKAGDGLDHIGQGVVGDAIRDWGDGAASDLGAEIRERQLGQTMDPTELIHGKPAEIRATAKNLRDFAAAFGRVGAGMKQLDSSHWKGVAADTFRQKFAPLPTDWLHAADACGDAAKALESYVTTITWAQGQAREAIILYKEGQEASRTALAAHDEKREAYNAARNEPTPPPRPEPFVDPGTAKLTRAQEILTAARTQRDTAAETARSTVTAALAHAPKEPTGMDRFKLDGTDAMMGMNVEATHFAGGVTKGVIGLTNFVRSVNPTDPYNLSHPAEYYKATNMTLAGLATTAAHPDRALKNMWDTAKADPSEFLGTLVPELIGTKGAGMGLKGANTARRAGQEAAAAGRAAEHGGGKVPGTELDGAAPNARKLAEADVDGPNLPVDPEKAELFARARESLAEDPFKPSRPEAAVEKGPSDPIDLATGVMYLPQKDVALPGTLPLAFTRRVASDYRSGRWFGPSWSSTADQRLEIDSEGIVLVCEDGLLLPYPHPAPGVPVLPTHGPARPLDTDAAGNYTITDPDTGRVQHFTTTGPHLALLTQIDDRNGNWITFEYTEESVPTAIVDSAGRHLKLTTEQGRITALHLAGAASDGSDQEIVRYGYTEGHLTSVTNSSGLPLVFTYDDRARVTSWTDTNDSRYEYAYDDQDRCIAEGGTEGHVALRVTYDDIDPDTGLRVTTATTGSGAVHRYLVNESHQIVAEIDPLGAVTRYERDRRHRLLSRTDPLGRTTRFEYDSETGGVIRAVRPDGREATAEYNALGLPMRVTGPDRLTTRQEYDERGNRTTVTDPSGSSTRFSFDTAGRLRSVTDPLGNSSRVRTDAAGLPLEITNPLGAVTRYTRDAFGRPTTITDALGATTRLDWTVEGLLAGRISPDGSASTWSYDGEGNCTSHTDPMGAVSVFEYTHFDLMTARTGPDGVRYEFQHDKELRLTQVRNPQGLTWDYTYDAAGHLVTETDFDDRTLTYTHDAAGRLTTRTDALNQTVRYTRDDLGRILSKDAAGAVTTYAYDLFDQLAEAAGPDATVTLLRDRHGRLKSETVNGRTLTFSHDSLGRRTSRRTPSGAASTWTYDAAGRRDTLTTSGRTLTFEHDDAGRELARHIGETVTLTSAYDALGRLTDQHVTSTGRSVQRRAYNYRADGNLTGIDDQLSGPSTFTLDRVGRVTSVSAPSWSESYAYDAAGNQSSASWPTTHPGQESTGTRDYTGTTLTRAGTVRYEHDALGRTTLRQKPRLSRKPDTWHYTWDAENHLTAVTTPDGTRWRYHYDPLGRRTSKQRLARDNQTVLEQTDFTWDGTTLCEQTTTSPALPNPVTLTWDHQGLHPLTQTERITAADASQTEVDERFFSIVTDLIGTPRELVDELGNIAWRARSSLWGATTWPTDSTAYTPLRFPGQYFDPETGLHYNFHRYYDPETGRYTSPDPLGLPPAPNPVAYVTDPHTVCDPFGLSPYANGDGPAIGEYTSKGEGKDLKRSAMVGDDQWHFNTGHGYDRAHTGPDGTTNDLRTTSLKPDQIEQAIVSDVYSYMRDGGVVPRTRTPEFTGPLDGSVKIDGHDVGYRVIQRPDGAYQLSTYWLNA